MVLPTDLASVNQRRHRPLLSVEVVWFTEIPSVQAHKFTNPVNSGQGAAR
ncbi:hypothetical protein GCM10027180_23770 [Microbulbifer echini]